MRFRAGAVAVLALTIGCAGEHPAPTPPPKQEAAAPAAPAHGPSRAHPDPGGALLEALGIPWRLDQPLPKQGPTDSTFRRTLPHPERYTLAGVPAKSITCVGPLGKVELIQVDFSDVKVLKAAAERVGAVMEHREGSGPTGKVYADYFDAISERSYLFGFAEWADPARTQLRQVVLTMATGDSARSVQESVDAGRRSD